MLKVLIATGGTGGHLFPSIQLGKQLEDCEVLFAGHKLKRSPFFRQNLPYQEIASASSKKKVFTLLKGIFQSLKLLLRFSPDIVVGFGSFHSFPLLMAALLLRKKIILFEPNCSLGKVNRLFAPFAKKLAFQFPIQHDKAVYVPLLPWKNTQLIPIEKNRDRKTILVFGGSQGASFINETFCKAAQKLSFPFEVIHLTGREDSEIQYSVPAQVKPFEEEMAPLYQRAHFAVCRCGAGTTAELIRYQVPAVVIPYPYAHDHQRKNGEFLGKGVRLLLQQEASVDRLVEEIEKLNDQLEEHKRALSEIKFAKTIELGTIIRELGKRQS